MLLKIGHCKHGIIDCLHLDAVVSSRQKILSYHCVFRGYPVSVCVSLVYDKLRKSGTWNSGEECDEMLVAAQFVDVCCPYGGLLTELCRAGGSVTLNSTQYIGVH